MTTKDAQYFLEDFIGSPSQDFYVLAQSGSSRRNFVGSINQKKYIITYNENIPENESFFYFSLVFHGLQLSTPAVLHISEDRKMYVQEFVGSDTLSEVITAEGESIRVKILVKKTLEQLVNLQKQTENNIDYSRTFEYQEYGDLAITNDLFYFKSFIADVLEIPYHKSALLQEFKNLTAKIAHLQPRGVMIRDFQSRNIMVNEDDDLSFIDYQAAMKGPLMYDVISFLFQAKANFSLSLKDEMLNYYISLWNDKERENHLKSSIPLIQLIRYLQVLGAYGFRGLIQKKVHFLSSLDQGIANLQSFASAWEDISHYPELSKLIKNLSSSQTEKTIKDLQ